MIELQDYEILKKIGSGGMGDVYLAKHKVLETIVAIKSLHSNLVSDKVFRNRFKTEAKVHSKLNHPNVVKLIDFQQRKDGLFIIMEYVKGIQLDDYINNETGPIPEKELILIFSQILDAISHAHKMGLVHRDIKPANIIISNGKIKVLDFGIAKELTTESGLTKTGVQVGTPMYMSPEQVNAEAVDKLSDIYSLGVTLFYMAVGKPPYVNSNVIKMGIQILSEPFPEAKKFYPSVSNKIEAIIIKATQKKKEDRYQNCEDFILALKNDVISSTKNHEKKSIKVESVKKENIKTLTKKKKSKKSFFSSFILTIIIGAVLVGIFFFINPSDSNDITQTENMTNEISSLSIDSSNINNQINKKDINYAKNLQKTKELADAEKIKEQELFQKNKETARYIAEKKERERVISENKESARINAENEERARVTAEKNKEKARVSAEKNKEKARVTAEKNKEKARVTAEKNKDAIYAINYFKDGVRQNTNGAYAKSIASFTSAINKDSDYAEAYFERGSVYFQMYEFEKALEDFSNNIRLQPKNFLSYRNRALCKSLVGRGDYCSDYKRACQLGDKDSCDKCP